MLILALSMSAYAVPPALSMEGFCPGPVDIQASEGTPDGMAALVWADGPGSFTLASGPCPGLEIPLDSPSKWFFRFGPDGTRDFMPTIPEGPCDKSYAVVDLVSCTVSPVTTILPPVVGGLSNEFSITTAVDSSYSVMEVRGMADGRTAVAWGTSAGAQLAIVGADGTVHDAWSYPELARAAGMDVTADGGFILAGEAEYFNNPTLLKVDAAGNPEWATTADEGYPEQGYYAVRELEDGRFAVGGIFDAMYDAAGNLEWQKIQIGGGGNVNSVEAFANGDLLIAGEGSSGVPADTYNWVVNRVTTDGVVVWSRALGGDGYDWAGGATEAADGGVFLTGWTGSVGISGGNDCGVVKLDSVGDLAWAIGLGDLGGTATSCYRNHSTADGGVVVVGGYGDAMFLAKVDAAGTLEWARSYADAIGYALDATADGGFVAVGKTGASDVLVVHTDAEGRSGCEADIPFTVADALIEIAPNGTDGGSSPAISPRAVTADAVGAEIVGECAL
ncbi:MAG: hypothetical protein ACI8PZ_001377 [Myxococcota bacterium]|jgi:hypothetical protein